MYIMWFFGWIYVYRSVIYINCGKSTKIKSSGKGTYICNLHCGKKLVVLFYKILYMYS
jgi:hypothetical protein